MWPEKARARLCERQQPVRKSLPTAEVSGLPSKNGDFRPLTEMAMGSFLSFRNGAETPKISRGFCPRTKTDVYMICVTTLPAVWGIFHPQGTSPVDFKPLEMGVFRYVSLGSCSFQ